MNIKQGDAYSIPVKILLNAEPLNLADVVQIEFYIGGFRKLYPGDVKYMPEHFYVPISQEESFSWEENSPIMLDVRVQFAGGNVYGIKRQIGMAVLDAVSEEVL